MAKNYQKFSYFESRPDVVKIFDDLDSYHDYCRLEGRRFDPADLYNKYSKTYNAFVAAGNGTAVKPKTPYLGKKPWNNTDNPRPANWKPKNSNNNNTVKK